jgi:glyoxylase-like metal-dependent hydrolase (beta-lactamase superfamily II)
VRGEAPHPQPALDSSLERWLFEKVTTDVAAHAGDSPEPFGPPPVPVDRELEDGDALDGWGAGARVLHVPGHTPGSVALHLPAEGVLFPGDNVAEAEGRVVLGPFNVDRAQAVASFRRLAALDDVGTVCVPHGEPLLSDVGRRLREATPEADWI